VQTWEQQQQAAGVYIKTAHLYFFSILIKSKKTEKIEITFFYLVSSIKQSN